MIPREIVYERPDTIAEQNPNEAVTNEQLQAIAGIKNDPIEFSSDIFDILSAPSLFNRSDPTAPPPGVGDPVMNSYYTNPIYNLIGGSATPGGLDTQVQFNDGGVLGGATYLNWDKTAKILYVGTNTVDGTIKAPDGTVDDGTALSIAAGSCKVSSGAGGGNASFTAGNGERTGAGGNVSITAGTGGGDITLQAGSGYDTNDNGGDIDIKAGAGFGTGHGGDITVDLGSGQAVDIIPGRLYLTAYTNGPTFVRMPGSKNTTDNTYHAVPHILATSANTAGYLHARVAGRRTGGTGGTANDMFATEIVQAFKNDAGTLNLKGSLTYVFFYQDVVNTDAKFAVNGTTIELQVRGDTNNNYTFYYEWWYTIL